ncbi:DUF6461 domain-containing protein [Krasilnikovia sp. M28-CT-15]|uniref:DUF6461 domain-containing protein n=1 Tax=Krasilnikovia sp. M28-CT-15 TaxID=3373540 RepID=UPI0038777F99
MTPTADDYRWLFEDDNGGFLAESYCATLVRQMTRADVLLRLGATFVQQATFGQVVDPVDLDDEEGRSYIAVAQIAGSALILEQFSMVGYDHRVSLSQGTTLATHFNTVNADTGFAYLHDGKVLLDFEPFYGDFRDAEDAELAEALRESGFVGDPGGEWTDHYVEAAFALASRLVGPDLSREALEGATYVYASVPER